MKILSKILMFAVVIAFFGCDSDDTDALADENYKPTLTITPNMSSGSVDEGTLITYDLSFDKPVNHNISLVAILVSGVAGADDVALGTANMAANSTSGSITIEFVNDLIPEEDESAVIKIVGANEDSIFWLNPNSDLSSFSYNIVSPVDPDGGLIVVLDWDLEAASDLDMFSVSENDGAWDQQWSADHPEIKTLIMGVDPDGTYYLGIDPYDVEADVTEFWYRWTLGEPDGSVTVIEGMFDYENRDTVYDVDSATGGTASYRLVTIQKNGSSYTAIGL